ncbi:hypothetical protein AN958_09454 [Leucoagaricus sp. SymC.cos]|nr:hypothetical protein AN958_09454 [Leucoagaricus sp. SymC.cos]
MYTLTKLRIVWTNACLKYIIGRGYPFPRVSLDSLSIQSLERHTCHSDQLAKKWLSCRWNPLRTWSTATTANTSVTDARLLPGSQGTLLFTLSKSVWSVVTLWQLEPVISRTPGTACTFDKRCEWSPRGAIFNGFALNSSLESEVKIAISILNNGKQTVELLSLKQDSHEWSLEPLLSVPTTFRPITLEGDILAMSDDFRETIIFNWRTRAYATLEHAQETAGISQYDHCIQVVFASHSILVVRARSLHLFPMSTLKMQEEGPLRYSPIARHSFGWVDSVSVQMTGSPEAFSSSSSSNVQQPLSILVRAETDDPWSSDILSMELYTLNPNPEHDASPSPEASDPHMTSSSPSPNSSPYIFPPVLTSRVSSRRGALRCRDIILGRRGTALWVQPRDRSVAGLYWTTDDNPLPVGPHTIVRSDYKHESAGGKEDAEEPEPEGKIIRWNEQHNWSSIDYDEDVGRIVLGTSFGSITILDM